MEYQGIREVAEAWGVSSRRVQRLCSEGRVEGARKFGRAWMIPVGAPKPSRPRRMPSEPFVPVAPSSVCAGLAHADDAGHVDGPAGEARCERAGEDCCERADGPAGGPGRARPLASMRADELAPAISAARDADALSASAERAPSVLSRLMPLMNTPFVPGECERAVEGLDDPGMLAVARAEYRYFSGSAEEAAREARKLLAHADPAVRLSACLIYAYANLTLGQAAQSRTALNEMHEALQERSDISAAHGRALNAFVGYTAATLLHLPLPQEAPPMKEFLALLPPGLRAFALYVHAHRLYLDGDYARSLGVIEAALMGQAATYPIPEIYLRLAASMDYMALRKPDEAREQLLIAWHIAQPDGLVEAFGEHHGLLGGLLEATLQQE